MEGGKQGYSLCARLGITSKFRAFVFVFFQNWAEVVPGLMTDLEWMREMLMTLERPECMPLTARLGSFTYIG